MVFNGTWLKISGHQQQHLQGAKFKHVHLQIIIDLNGRTHTNTQTNKVDERTEMCVICGAK